MRDQAIDGGPARRVGAVTGRVVRRVTACSRPLAGRGGAPGRPGIPARGGVGPQRCHAVATCFPDRARAEPPGGRWSSSRLPGYGPTYRAVHGTRAGCTTAAAKKFLLRDHAPPQRQAVSEVGAQTGRAGGAPARPRRAGFWRPHPGVVWPGAAPPASAAPGRGRQGLGSSAGSTAAAGNVGHSLCAGKGVVAVVADSASGGRLLYDDDNPRERYLPRESPGRTRYRSPRALIDAASGRSSVNLSCQAARIQRRKQLAKGAAKETIINQTAKETV